MHTAINKVLSLVKKTGDRCVVINQESDEAYVVMSLAEYERMTVRQTAVSELSEDELLDKINRDIAVWKSQQYEGLHSDKQLNAEHGTQKPDFDPYTDNLANESQNSDDFDDFLGDFSEEEQPEEPFYFEKIS